MVRATALRFSPCTARTEAAPSVGPTQGLQTAEQQPDAELTAQAVLREAAEALLGPVAERAARRRHPRMQHG